MKIVLGVVAGVVVAFLCVAGVETIGHLVFPPPPGTDINNPEQLKQLIAAMPKPAIAMVAVAWFVGALGGAFAADKIAGRAIAGWIVAVLVLVGGVVTMLWIPHPWWMWAAGIALPLVAGWLAQKLAKVPA